MAPGGANGGMAMQIQKEVVGAALIVAEESGAADGGDVVALAHVGMHPGWEGRERAEIA